MDPKSVRNKESWSDRAIAPMGASVLVSLLKDVAQSCDTLAWMWSEAPAEFAEGKVDRIASAFIETLEEASVHRGVLELAASLRPGLHEILESFNTITQKFEETANSLKALNLETFQSRCEEITSALKNTSSSIEKACEGLDSVVVLDVELSISSSKEKVSDKETR